MVSIKYLLLAATAVLAIPLDASPSDIDTTHDNAALAKRSEYDMKWEVFHDGACQKKKQELWIRGDRSCTHFGSRTYSARAVDTYSNKHGYSHAPNRCNVRFYESDHCGKGKQVLRSMEFDYYAVTSWPLVLTYQFKCQAAANQNNGDFHLQNGAASARLECVL